MAGDFTSAGAVWSQVLWAICFCMDAFESARPSVGATSRHRDVVRATQQRASATERCTLASARAMVPIRRSLHLMLLMLVPGLTQKMVLVRRQQKHAQVYRRVKM